MLKEGPEEPAKKTHRNDSYLLEINLQASYFISCFFFVFFKVPLAVGYLPPPLTW